MSKYDVLGEVAGKVSALDNDVKLKILALLIEEGSKSITDIARDLDLNFSTAHKYLEQLEAAGLVGSKEVSENRLKRLFTIKDFNIDLSPKGISQMISGNDNKKPKKGLKVLNQQGELVDFNEKLFAQKYLKRGMPQGTIVSAMSSILENAYDGITLLELLKLFRDELQKKVQSIQDLFKQLEESEKHKRTYTHLLEMLHPEALNMHVGGDIFIKNLSEPRLLSFVHDIRGLSIHGAAGKQPKNLKELFDQADTVISNVAAFSQGNHVFDSFNFFIAPLAEKENYLSALKNFLVNLNKKISSSYICLEAGVPRFVKRILPDYVVEGSKTIDYNKYLELATKISKDIISIIKTENLENIKVIIKIWEKDALKGFGTLAPGTFVANMIPEWQSINASYVGEKARFDAEWKGWNRTVRMGEMQTISVNLPRLALKSKSEAEFFAALKQVVKDCCEFILNMAELAFGEFLRKYETQIKSAQKIKWDYVHLDDCVYSISLVGLNEAIKILTGENLDTNLALGKKIINVCNASIVENKASPFRIQLKEETDPNIINRFYNLDSKIFDINVKDYSPGACSGSSSTHIKLHQMLLGGHCATASQNELSGLKDFGLVKIK